MKRIVYTIAFCITTLLIFFQCTTNSSEEDPSSAILIRIDSLEKALESNPQSKEVQRELYDVYIEKIGDFSFNSEKAPYFKKLGDLSLQMNNPLNATNFYTWTIKADPKSEKRELLLYNTTKLYHSVQNIAFSDFLSSLYLELYPKGRYAQEVKGFLTGAPIDFKILFDSLGNNIISELKKSQYKSAKTFIDYSELFAAYNPASRESPDRIQQSAMILKALHSHDKLISFYQWLIHNYPDHVQAENALFSMAIHYDDRGDTIEARKYYQKYIDKYPNGKFAKDTKVLINNLGKDIISSGKN